MTARTAAALVPALLVPALLAAGCARTAVKVPLPDAGPDTTALCETLRLPERVSGQKRRTTDPESPLVAAWGSPAIGLRCGVPRPADAQGLVAKVVDLDGLLWLPQEGVRVFTWTLVGRAAYVEVTIPGKYTENGRPAGDVLSDLGPALKALPALADGAY